MGPDGTKIWKKFPPGLGVRTAALVTGAAVIAVR
jgi:hypothetical protein